MMVFASAIIMEHYKRAQKISIFNSQSAQNQLASNALQPIGHQGYQFHSQLDALGAYEAGKSMAISELEKDYIALLKDWDK